MNFKIKSSILLTTFLKYISAFVALSNFFHIITNDMHTVVPIPNDPDLDTSFLDFFKNEFFISKEFNRAELPPELKEKIRMKQLIKIIYPPADFDTTYYLQFYLWLNNFYFETTINSDFIKNILYYLNYFQCNTKELLFLLFEHIKFLSIDTDEALSCLFVEIKNYSFLLNLFSNTSNDNIEVTFKISYYNWQLKRLLVADTYNLDLCKSDGIFFICILLKVEEVFLSQIELIKVDISDKTKLTICIDMKILHDAIEKSKSEFYYFFETFDSLTICSKIFESLEYLVTEGELEEKKLIYKDIWVYNSKYDNIPIFNSVNHLFSLTQGLEPPGYINKIEIDSEFCDSNDILNIFEFGLCCELFIKCKVCKIRSLDDMKRVFTFVYKVEIKEENNIGKIKLILRDFFIKNDRPVFLKVILLGEINSSEIRMIYSSSILAEFWGPLSDDLTLEAN